MVTLRIDNSECSVQGLSALQLKELRDLLSYELPSKPGSYARRSSLLSAKGVFPSGLKAYVFDYLATNKVEYRLVELRTVPKPKLGMFRLNLKD